MVSRSSIVCVAAAILTLCMALPEPKAEVPAPKPKTKESCIPVVIAEFTGKVVGISDGDTLKVLTADKIQVTIRLEGIDCPEKVQSHGDKAKAALSDLTFGKTVTVKKTGQDRYGRTLALIYVGDLHVNDQMVADGWAWQFVKYNCEERVAKLEKEARQAKKGLWAIANPTPPWEFRARQKGAAAETRKPFVGESAQPANGKFWLNTGSNIRHNSKCEWFNNTSKGRFCGPNDGKPCKICGG